MTGEHNVILDDKFRLTLPAQLRKGLNEITIKIMKGNDGCLWLYTIQKWEERFGKVISELTDPFSAKDLRLQRKYISSTQEIEIDKSGRILIPETLRKYAGIDKDCIVSGMLEFCEIWDSKRHAEYIDESDEENKREFDNASEDFSQIIKRKKGII